MKNIYFTVGPSQLYPTVLRHLQTAMKLHIGSLSHRSKGFEELYEETSVNLRTLLGIPKTHHLFFLSSSLEAMERTIENTVAGQSLHLMTGDFGQKFYDTALKLGKKPKIHLLPPGSLDKVTSLRVTSQTELLCVTQNETSTGIAIPPEMIYMFKKQNPNLLVALDVVSSVPY